MNAVPPDPVTAAEPLPAASLSLRPSVPLTPAWRLATGLMLGASVLLAVAALAVAWKAQSRVAGVEQELVRRQQESAGQAGEARLIAKEAQDGVRDAAAKVALLEARVAEISVQRVQLDELIQSLARSRDDNLLGDVESAIRGAAQQTEVGGSAEPLVAALKQADDRLARNGDARLDPVRRAVARDLDRIKAVSVSDLPSLGIKLDEAMRLIDDLPLAASADAHRETAARALAAPPSRAPSAPATLATFDSWTGVLGEWWSLAAGRVGAELRALIRVTRVDHPEALLLAPDQGFFVRENLKLRLLNARLALMSRQPEAAQADLTVVRTSIEHWFDKNSRRTATALDLVRQIAVQARQNSVPRPDETLAALVTATATATRH